MTISDMRCDGCAVMLSGLEGGPQPGPIAGVRFTYHPGDPAMRDDSGVLCGPCWTRMADSLGARRSRACANCGAALRRRASLFVRRMDEHDPWQLCAPHAADLLNTLRTVSPKLDRETFRLPLDTPETETADE